MDLNGQVHVLDTGNHRVQRFNKVGGSPIVLGGEGSGDGEFIEPSAIAVDPSEGFLYVVDQGSQNIARFNLVGVFFDAWDLVVK